MVLKQASTQTCRCGAPIIFPEGEVRIRCLTKVCGAHWECGAEGFWSIAYRLWPVYTKPTHYEKYMTWRNKNKRKRRRK